MFKFLIPFLISSLFFATTILADTKSGSNSSNYTINDTVYEAYSPITISGAPSGAVIDKIVVSWNVDHDDIGDVKVKIGTNTWSSSWATLSQTGDDSWDGYNHTSNISSKTYYPSASQSVNQTWYLVGQNYFSGQEGRIDSWSITVYYTVIGSLKVNITPSDAVSDGARWSVDGGSWKSGGTTVTGLEAGSHTISYRSVSGWNKPSDKTVTISGGQTTTVTAYYDEILGDIKVNLYPSGAVSNGARWRVVGESSWNNSGATVSGYDLGNYTIEYRDATNYLTPANLTLNVGEGLNNVSTTYLGIGSLKVNITPSAAVSDGAMWRVDGGSWQNSGATVTGLAAESHTISYKSISGWNTPSNKTVSIGVGQTATTTAYYDEVLGDIKVNLYPSGAVSNGARWRVVGESSWNNSGATVSGYDLGNYTIEYRDATNYLTPANLTLNVGEGLNNVSTTYLGIGSLKVNITPSAAVSDGAMWRVDGGSWQNSGATVTGLAAESHTISYKSISGWNTPTNKTVTISAGQTATTTAYYDEVLGDIKVNLYPSGAVSNGARWRVVGESSWNNSGATVSGYDLGNYTIEYHDATDYLTPANLTLNVGEGLNNVSTTYAITDSAEVKVTDDLYLVSEGDGNVTVDVRNPWVVPYVLYLKKFDTFDSYNSGALLTRRVKELKADKAMLSNGRGIFKEMTLGPKNDPELGFLADETLPDGYYRLVYSRGRHVESVIESYAPYIYGYCGSASNWVEDVLDIAELLDIPIISMMEHAARVAFDSAAADLLYQSVDPAYVLGSALSEMCDNPEGVSSFLVSLAEVNEEEWFLGDPWVDSLKSNLISYFPNSTFADQLTKFTSSSSVFAASAASALRSSGTYNKAKLAYYGASLLVNTWTDVGDFAYESFKYPPSMGEISFAIINGQLTTMSQADSAKVFPAITYDIDVSDQQTILSLDASASQLPSNRLSDEYIWIVRDAETNATLHYSTSASTQVNFLEGKRLDVTLIVDSYAPAKVTGVVVQRIVTPPPRDQFDLEFSIADTANPGEKRFSVWTSENVKVSEMQEVSFEFGDGVRFVSGLNNEVPITLKDHTFSKNGIYQGSVALLTTDGRFAQATTEFEVNNVASTKLNQTSTFGVGSA